MNRHVESTLSLNPDPGVPVKVALVGVDPTCSSETRSYAREASVRALNPAEKGVRHSM